MKGLQKEIQLLLAIALIGTLSFAKRGAQGNEGACDSLCTMEAQQVALFEQLAPTVVLITTSNGFGSGVFVDASGLILTNAHVVGTSETVEVVLYNQQTLVGSVLERADGDIDLAIVQVNMPTAPVPHFGNMNGVRVGAWAGAIGHGSGTMWTYNVGMISNVYPDAEGRSVFQTQIPLNRGNSGGPIFDRNGRVIGIVTAGVNDANSINFGISIDVAFTHLKSLSRVEKGLMVTAPAGVPIFIDGQMAGLGPHLKIDVQPGSHEIFAIIDGRKVDAKIDFPETTSLILE